MRGVILVFVLSLGMLCAAHGQSSRQAPTPSAVYRCTAQNGAIFYLTTPKAGCTVVFTYTKRPLPRTFWGYGCTQDCSGHDAGYQWAEERGITDESSCGGNSQSFIEGCQAFIEEQQAGPGLDAQDDADCDVGGNDGCE